MNNKNDFIECKNCSYRVNSALGYSCSAVDIHINIHEDDECILSEEFVEYVWRLQDNIERLVNNE